MGSGRWRTVWRRSVEDSGQLGDSMEEVGGGQRPVWGQHERGRWRAAGSGMAGDVDAAAARTSGDGVEEVDGGRHGLGDSVGLGERRCWVPRQRRHEGSGTTADGGGARIKI
uniref:Uncharacterized protein n=1 Tax=Oryza nivara TaxID=4536 RepID=A0A0E0JA31_ORYNI